MENNNKHIEPNTPNLNKINGKNSFNTPQGYFDSLESKIKQSISLEETMEEIKPNEGLKVPNSYFNNLEGCINKKPEAKIVPFFNKRLIGIAASLAAIFIVSFFIFKPGELKDDNLLASNISYTELTAGDYFESLTETELPLDGIVFEDINIEEETINEELEEIINEEEIEIDVIDIIDYEEDFDLF